MTQEGQLRITSHSLAGGASRVTIWVGSAARWRVDILPQGDAFHFDSYAVKSDDDAPRETASPRLEREWRRDFERITALFAEHKATVEEYKHNARGVISELTKECDARRALIKEAEYANDNASCPWCGEVAIGRRYESPPHRPAHAPTCRAFFPNGVAR